jgi:hypothetical protein
MMAVMRDYLFRGVMLSMVVLDRMLIGLLPPLNRMVGSEGASAAARRAARMPARSGGGHRIVIGRCWLRGMCKEGGAG